MEGYHRTPSSYALTSSSSRNENVGLLIGSEPPLVRITPAVDEYSTVRARRNSTDTASIGFDPHSESSNMVENPDYSTDSRPPMSSPGQSSAAALLRRLPTFRSPIKTSHSTRKARGGSYNTLDDNDVDPVAVDLSSLGGFEMTGTPNMRSPVLHNQDTAYVRLGASSEQPGMTNINRQHSRLGNGLVIGAQLEREPTQQQASSSGHLMPNNEMDRSKTMRRARSLAQEGQMIVAVNEGIDLSSLEGGQLNHRASQESLEAIALRSRTLETAPKSYFFPEDPDIPNWRPFSMRSVYILFLAAISLGLAVFQEWFCRHSMALFKKNKGVLQFNSVTEVSTFDFFAWKYLPTMITIIYAVLFSIMDYDIRRLEPYYQLSKREGSRAAASLNLDHLTMFQYFVPFKAARLKQWPVFFSTIGNIIASTVAPSIQNPSITLVSNLHCQGNSTCPPDEMRFFVLVSPGWSRALSAVLAIVAAIAVGIFFMLRRKSGLLSDPKGIAGIASMATKSHILADFQGMDLATRGEIHKRLQHRRFVLYKSSIWQGEWTQASEPIQESQSRLESPHPLMLQLKAGIPLLSFMVFGLVSVPLISLTNARVVPNAVPWLPILLATLLKLFFSTFESDVRLMEPFHALSEGKALPQNSLTLDYQGTVYGWIVVKALMNKHILVALVGLASISLDVLSVTVSSFSVNSQIFLHRKEGADPANQDETFISFWTSVILSIVILTFVMVVTCLVYLRRRHPFLPREPSTIAAVLAFIYASNMLDDFIDTERLTNKQMETRLKGLGKTYALGWFRGRDKKMHCAIDQEPLRSKYVHGISYEKSQAPWERMEQYPEYHV